MNENIFQNILDSMRGVDPPVSIEIIKNISEIDWGNVSKEEIDSCKNLLLRVSADLIMVSSMDNLKKREIYYQFFLTIRRKVSSSNLLNSDQEFEYYFQKYLEYMDDF